jgi:chemotaxis protein methyltransferase CheR
MGAGAIEYAGNYRRRARQRRQRLLATMTMNQPMLAPTQSTAGQVIHPVSDHEFALFQKLIYSKAGIHLAPAKKALLEARLTRRLRELGLQSFAAYYQKVLAVDDGEELVILLDRITTNETQFFRQPKQFEFLDNQIIPAWQTQGHAASGGRRSIRVWSAACSTGEEPYSIAMMLSDHFAPGSGWDFEILATDLSTRVLAAASAAVWPVAKACEIPNDYLKKYMLKGTGEQEGKMKAGPEIRSVIRFERLNLNDDYYPVEGNFDLIFCRNVLIYFDTRARAGAIARLIDHLAPNGYLFVGHAESLHSVTGRVRYVLPTIYSNCSQPQLAVKPQRHGVESTR